MMQNRLALHTWTLDTTPLAGALRAAKRGGWDAVELRRIDFARCFDAGMTHAQVLELVRASGLKVACIGTEYGLIFARGEEKKRLLKVLDETCANAVAVGCDLVMIAPGRLSTTTCWPSNSVSPGAMLRALMSTLPPGANGTTRRTGRVG